MSADATDALKTPMTSRPDEVGADFVHLAQQLAPWFRAEDPRGASHVDVAVSGLMYDSRVGSDDASVGVGDEDAAELVVVAHEHAVEEFLGASEGVVHGARVDPELEHRGLGDHRAGGGGRRPGVGGGVVIGGGGW